MSFESIIKRSDMNYTLVLEPNHGVNKESIIFRDKVEDVMVGEAILGEDLHMIPLDFEPDIFKFIHVGKEELFSLNAMNGLKPRVLLKRHLRLLPRAKAIVYWFRTE